VIWLLRHGEAEDGGGKPDAERELTSKGERQSRAAGEAIKAMGIELEACLASPKVRAHRTAEIACEPLGVGVEADERLRDGDFDPLELAAGRGEVLLVGHEPDFSNALAAATGSRLKLKKGGLAGFENGVLHVLIRPRELKAIAP
jgi:phosphohistidine phosphatase